MATGSNASPAKSFSAPLEQLRGNLGWVVAWLPFDPAATWKQMNRLRVTVEIGGQLFRTSLFPESGFGWTKPDTAASKHPAPRRYFVLVNKKMQKAAGAGVGGIAHLTVAPDLEERVPELPPELAKLLKGQKTLIKWMENFSVSNRLEIGKWIEAVKSPEARQKRAEQMAERLLLSMEGEKELPPILDLAFRRTPAARKGWNAMTPHQRRNLLMAIFYYQSPEARQRRVDKVVEQCMGDARP